MTDDPSATVRPVLLWRWRDAPGWLQRAAPELDERVWLAHVPSDVDGHTLMWALAGDARCRELEDGSMVLVASG